MSEDFKEFVKRHRYEICLGTGLVVSGMVLLYFKQDIAKLTEIAMNSLEREERRIMFEIQDIYESIERLDDTKPINRFHKIPKRLARIEELKVDLLHIQKEKYKVNKH